MVDRPAEAIAIGGFLLIGAVLGFNAIQNSGSEIPDQNRVDAFNMTLEEQNRVAQEKDVVFVTSTKEFDLTGWRNRVYLAEHEPWRYEDISKELEYLVVGANNPEDRINVTEVEPEQVVCEAMEDNSQISRCN